MLSLPPAGVAAPRPDAPLLSVGASAAAGRTEPVAALADEAGFPLMIDLRPGLVILDSGKDQWVDDAHGLDLERSTLRERLGEAEALRLEGDGGLVEGRASKAELAEAPDEPTDQPALDRGEGVVDRRPGRQELMGLLMGGRVDVGEAERAQGPDHRPRRRQVAGAVVHARQDVAVEIEERHGSGDVAQDRRPEQQGAIGEPASVTLQPARHRRVLGSAPLPA